MRRRLRMRLLALGWPSYECELCVGQDPGIGCWCGYHGASAPGIGPEKWRVRLRKILRWIYRLDPEDWP